MAESAQQTPPQPIIDVIYTAFENGRGLSNTVKVSEHLYKFERKIHPGFPLCSMVLATIIEGDCITFEGVHVPSMLSTAGALAGFGVAQGSGRTFGWKKEAFVERNGQSYLLLPALEEPLLGTSPGVLSVWSLIAGAMRAEEQSLLPDPKRIQEHVISTLGTPRFGQLALPVENQPKEQPPLALARCWKIIAQVLATYHLHPMLWGFTLAEATQRLIRKGARAMTIESGVRIAIEAAIIGSKVDPFSVPVGGFGVKPT